MDAVAAADEGKYHSLGFLTGITDCVNPRLTVSVGLFSGSSCDMSSDPTINFRWTGTSIGIGAGLGDVMGRPVSLVDFRVNQLN